MPLNLCASFIYKRMSFSLKQLKAAIREVNAEQTPAKTAKKAKPRKKKRGAVSSAVPGTSGGVTVSTGRPATFAMAHREYLGQLTVAASASYGQGAFVLHPSSFPWLVNLSKSFEKYQWTSLVLEYVPDVGTTKDGSVAWGIDWGITNAKVANEPLLGREVLTATYDRAAIVALTPSSVVPLWRPNKLSVPQAVLQSRRWYSASAPVETSLDDYAPGSLAYYVTAATGTVGDVWAQYRVVFAGTRKP